MGLRSTLFMLVGGVGLAAAAALGSSAPVGSLVGSKNATLDGQVPLPHTTVLSGDNLQVRSGLAMVTLDQGSRMILGGETEVSFRRGADGVAVSLTHGNMSLYHSEAGTRFRVKIGDVIVVPTRGCRTMGEIAMVSGLLRVTAKEGALEVEASGTTKEVRKGRTIMLASTVGRVPAPTPPGNQHIGHKAHLTMAAVAGGAVATLVTIALVRTSRSASSVVPKP